MRPRLNNGNRRARDMVAPPNTRHAVLTDVADVADVGRLRIALKGVEMGLWQFLDIHLQSATRIGPSAP